MGKNWKTNDARGTKKVGQKPDSKCSKNKKKNGENRVQKAPHLSQSWSKARCKRLTKWGEKLWKTPSKSAQIGETEPVLAGGKKWEPLGFEPRIRRCLATADASRLRLFRNFPRMREKMTRTREPPGFKPSSFRTYFYPPNGAPKTNRKVIKKHYKKPRQKQVKKCSKNTTKNLYKNTSKTWRKMLRKTKQKTASKNTLKTLDHKS